MLNSSRLASIVARETQRLASIVARETQRLASIVARRDFKFLYAGVRRRAFVSSVFWSNPQVPFYFAKI
ncbi:hypothetical protein LEP1GSC066_3457 [Leptospira sp. serovar Kenya str. Sh9]|nr:hypothetical protein LEP1GSC066_3457 [Leptospira sp. serovar Kenya str. Sh9]